MIYTAGRMDPEENQRVAVASNNNCTNFLGERAIESVRRSAVQTTEQRRFVMRGKF